MLVGQWHQDSQGLAVPINLKRTRLRERTGISWSKKKSEQGWRKDVSVGWWDISTRGVDSMGTSDEPKDLVD